MTEMDEKPKRKDMRIWISIIGIPILIVWALACHSGGGHPDCFACRFLRVVMTPDRTPHIPKS
jgi:hypothetical protein